MATPDINAIRNARVAFRSIRHSFLLALNTVGDTQKALDQGKRIYAPDRPELVPLQTARDNAIGAAASLRSAEKNARGAIASAISDWVTNISVDTDVARMTTNGPIVLFPIRIETRFGVDNSSPPKPVLRVRIYPDEIFVNLHEPAITTTERDAAQSYYTQRDQQGGDENGELWRQLLDIMTPERAAYVLRLLTPHFSGGTSTGTNSVSVGPEFPTDYALKQNDFSRPAEAVLPDRWIVRTVSGITNTDYPGKAIPEPLIITPDPQKKDPSELFQIPGSNPALFVDDEIAWTVDYQRALDVGMAVTIPLTAAQATPGTGGFDKIMVFGVKTSFDQNDTTVFLDQLFDDHHYTRGLALVPQGTPTNNTEDEPTSLPISDPDGSISFNVERKPTAPSPISSALQDTSLTSDLDGNRLSRILGIHSGVFSNVAGARNGEQNQALNMATLLWPTTYGYMVEQLMAPLFSPNQHDQIRDYFLSNVRACGPAPAFRIGQVPYGVLPALSVVNWQQRGSTLQEQFENAARTTILHCREAWKNAALLSLPKVTPGAADPLADLLNVLALNPSAQVMFARQSTGPIATLDLFNWFGIDYQTAYDEGKSIVADLLGRVAQPTWATALLAQMTHSDTSKQVAIPLIGAPETIGNIQLDTRAIALFAANITDLVNDTVNLPTELKETVFYKLARMALLEAKIRRSIAVIKTNNPGGLSAVFLEAEVLLTQTPVPFAPLLLYTGVTGGPLGDSDTVKNDAQVAAVYAALLSLFITTTGQIERQFSETLDLCSHRLDAWLTGFATRRLLEMRTAQQTSGVVPVGNYYGGYAFVENVRPVARNTTNLPGYGTVETQDGNGGFVHAPSLSHATAGTILRNGYMSYHDESPSKYAFDLSSARVRVAREIFGEVRAGQPLGAVFGYRFERGVAQNYPVSLGLNQYRYALRTYFPLVANKAGGPSTVPNNLVAAIAARNVVDGLALWNAFQANTIPWDTATDLPRRTIVVNNQTVPNPPYTALATEITKLGDMVDAVSDLNIGEGLLQLARGNVSAAAANLDSLARGTPPPDPETAVSQRGGTPATHRVALTFTGAGIPISPGDGWTATVTPRANASLTLDNWAGRILGNPTFATAHVTLDPVDPKTATATSVDISLADLGLRPLDVVAIARASATANAGSILDRRFAVAAAQILANNNDTTHQVGAIAYNPTPSPNPPGTPQVGPASIPQVMEVARAIGALLGGARNLAADDLSSSIDAVDARKSTDPANIPLVDDQSDIATHASDATGAINDIITTLNSGTGLVAALVAASDYFADAFPAPGSTDASLAVTIAPTIAAELQRRVKAAADAVQTLASTAGSIAAQRVEQFRALFGNDFLVLPPFFPPNPAELGLSLGALSTLLPQTEDANAPQQFIQQAAQVYEGLGRFRTLSLYMGALNLPPFRFDMAQLPNAGEPWIGLRFANRTTPLPAPLPGRQSLLLFSPSTLAPAASDIWQGIVVQDWVEVIPNNMETTGLGFNFDNPGAEAPQAILVIPPSTTGGNWKTSDIWATLSETFDLARIRGVDLEMVGGFGQFLPAIYASNNIALQTASASFANDVFDVPLP